MLELERRLGALFAGARYFGIWFDDAEMKYIETKVKTDRLYRVFSGSAYGCEENTQAVLIWLEQFLSDPDCPNGVRIFIMNYISHYRGHLKDCDELDGTKRYAEYLQHSFLTDLWMDKTRGGG